MITIIIAAALVIVLILVVSFNAKRESLILDRLHVALRTAGDDGVAPRTVDAALDRFENVLHSDETDLDARRAYSAFHHMATGAVITDVDGTEVARNRAAEPYASGRHGDALVESVIKARLEDALDGESTDEELRLHGPPERHLVVVGSPLLEEGELLGAVVLVDDVSEQKRLDAVRRDFVANVSHELRTPVGALSLLAETLEGETDTAVIANFLARIQDESGRLSRLIDSLLDLSKIEEGLSERTEDVDVAAVIRESAVAVQAAADHKNITLNLELAEVPLIMGDTKQLLSAITNLMSNAVKYTPGGGEVTARLAGHVDEVAIAIADNGVGIPRKDLNRVFERFYRVDRGRHADTGGTGLGLSIVRNVAVNHGGRVEVVSEEGVGSTFSMILPTRGAPYDVERDDDPLGAHESDRAEANE